MHVYIHIYIALPFLQALRRHVTQSRTVPDDVSLEFQLRLESDLNFVLMVFYLVNSWSWKSISLISLLDLISLCSSAKLRPATGSHRRSVGRSDSSRKHWPSSGRMHHDASYQSYLYIYIHSSQKGLHNNDAPKMGRWNGECGKQNASIQRKIGI